LKKYSDSYTPSLYSRLVGLVSLVVSLLPSRLKDFMFFVFVRDLQEVWTRTAYGKFGTTLMAPMFRSMQFPSQPGENHPAIGSSLVLGTWERQIQDIIVELGPFDLFVDIGAADGIYPVALLKSGLAKQAIAFESRPQARDSIRALARANSVSVEVQGTFDRDSLNELLEQLSSPGKKLLLVDVEGAETNILSVEAIEALAACPGMHLIVEMHPHLSGDSESQELAERLRARFAVRELDASNRSLPKEAEVLLRGLPDWEVQSLVSELRQVWMTWLYCSN